MARRAKICAARVLTCPAAARLISTVTGDCITRDGVRIDLGSPDFCPRVRAQLFWGIYESAEIRMIRAYLRSAETVVELGSSLGVTAAHIASVTVPGGRLLCVEANPRLVPGIRSRVGDHASHLRLEIENAAIADRMGEVRFQLTRDTLTSRLATDQCDGSISVPATTLGALLARREIGEFDLVSDIEGAEATFLLGDRSALDRCRRVVIELHATTYEQRRVTPEELLEGARELGFQVVDRRGVVVALSR